MSCQALCVRFSCLSAESVTIDSLRTKGMHMGALVMDDTSRVALPEMDEIFRTGDAGEEQVTDIIMEASRVRLRGLLLSSISRHTNVPGNADGAKTSRQLEALITLNLSDDPDAADLIDERIDATGDIMQRIMLAESIALYNRYDLAAR